MTINKALVIGSGALLMGLVSLRLPAPASPESQPRGQQTIRLNVEMVSLPVVVTDRTGQRVLDLKKDDFEVLEDGVVQEISGFSLTDEPVSVAFALDTSGSVEDVLPRIQNEAIRFVNLLHPDDSVAIMSFAEDVELLEDWSINRERNAYGIKETRPGTCTKVYEAVWLALHDVLKPVKEKTALVLFTDGVDTASHQASRSETIELAKESRAAIYSIYFTGRMQGLMGIGTGRPRIQSTPPFMPPPAGSGCGAPTMPMFSDGHKYLTELADYSGGRVFDARELQDLSPAFEEIAKELSSQYSIGYYSNNNKRDGKFRRIQVKVKREDLRVQTRKGYYAPKDKKS